MGGGSELPQRGGSERELLLCVQPAKEEESAKTIAELKEEFPNVDVEYIHQQFFYAPQDVNVPQELYKRATYLWTISWLPPTASAAPNLKFIQFSSAGVNHVAKHPIYTDSKIPLLSANGVHGPQIAEWVIMMHLIHSHKYIDLYEQQKQKTWKQDTGRGVRDNPGKTVGILGYGSIGRQVARVATAMGMNVIAYTASPRPTPESRRDNGFIVPGTGDPDGSFPSAWYSGLDKASLHKFLETKIDLLVLAVPLTKETTHFLSTEEFALLNKSNPSGTYVANIARGQVIDSAALIKALESKQISGAALDVTDPEPLPKEDPLWDAPNVLITPHISGATDVYAERACQLLRENLRRVRDGGKLINEVDRKRGY
ncbi:hypothetical protein P280DRAFT_524261 [Massarina eburnea CBS 473.64]|uniref:D-isomer specific 2-hydroxyacid dehydrogenase NAD-binding domain-containing protein n=1 Tax=Massarina eburnea CBS 473.64 TaxID=1395130 RepID=A0A6A6RGM0_9PLEO|nr:hypothetical protein P280DRAFT_524261 [Massarina eburnea CBS 473.64]